MIKNLVCFVLLIFTFSGCGVDSCDYDCSEGAIYLTLVFLDAETEENLFRNGTAHIKNLKVYRDNQEVEFLYHQLKRQILLGPFYNFQPAEDYQFLINSALLTTLTFGVDEIVEDCCTNYAFTEVTASDGEVTLDDNGIYHIHITP
ncbi:MAG: hypothetical protein GX163_00380 [Bacteroidetes bacterium]|jgi:hypothetical protein|nr:hypothetical protein [Bacteroidota bacterium]